MNILFTVIFGFIIFSIGFSMGFVTFTTFRKMRSYAGIMKITREDNKVLYSLELHEDPVMLQHASEIVFKVETSDESSDRK